MVPLATGALFGTLLAVFAFVRWRRRTLFVIKVRDGQAESALGRPDTQFILDVERICALWGIRNGVVHAVRTRRGMRIRCRGPVKSQARRFKMRSTTRFKQSKPRWGNSHDEKEPVVV